MDAQSSHQEGGDCSILIRLLGGFQVTIGDRTINETDWRLANAGALVKLLALAPRQRLHREQFVEHFWPALAPDAAANNLRYTLHVARRMLAPELSAVDHLIQYQQGWLSLRVRGGLRIDVVDFERAAAAAERNGDLQAHYQALDLYTGDLLPGDRYEVWTTESRERLRQIRLGLLHSTARIHVEREEIDLAIDALARIVKIEPVDEDANVLLMRLLANLGLRHQALVQYHRMQKALADEVDAEPSPAAQRLYRQIVLDDDAADRAGEWPGRIADDTSAAPTEGNANLPAALTSFVGRESEIADLRRSVLNQRLVTLTGPGGAGKTRLALQAAEGLGESFPDGIWLVDLSTATDPPALSQQVAGVLSIRDRPGQALEESVELYLRDKRVLLVFDNCEHLRDACARLVHDLLRACPKLHVLATSRVLLNVPGEALWHVQPLSIPPVEDEPVSDGRRYEAIDLFVERARLVRPDFALTAETATAVVEICCRLDGMPLAIELAAARLRTISLDDIVASITSPLALLDNGSRVVLERHQTLRAAIAWSFSLLCWNEGILARRLAVFAGGWTAAGALEVAADERLQRSEVPGLLASLVDKSLVQKVPVGEADRYRFLETIRAYALEELVREAEADDVRLRHANYYMRLAELGDAEFRGSARSRWLDWWRAEGGNLRAALDFLIEGGRRREGLHCCSVLTRFWTASGQLSEGRRWYARLLADDMPETSTVAMTALFGDGRLAYAQGDYAGASARFTMSLQIARELDDQDFAAGSLVQLGHVAVRDGDYTAARERYGAGLIIRRRQGDGWYLAVVLDGLGQVAMAEGDYSAARDYCEESLELYRRSGDRAQIARSLALFGHIEYLTDNYSAAHDRLTESLSNARAANHQQGIALAYAGLGHVTAAEGDILRSNELFELSRELYAQIGAQRVVTTEIDALAWPTVR